LQTLAMAALAELKARKDIISLGTWLQYTRFYKEAAKRAIDGTALILRYLELKEAM
jgi:hypothetical protein